MASIYDYTTNQIALNLSPLIYRKTRWQSWFRALLWPLQWLRDNWFNEYKSGSIAPYWTSIGTYAKGFRVIDDLNYGVYEALSANGPGVQPSLNPDIWIQVSPDFRGTNERVKYNNQKLLLEFILNKFFRTTFRQPDDVATPTNSDIYIEQAVPTNYYFIVQDADAGSPVIDGDQFSNEYIIDDGTAATYIYRTIFVPDSGSSPLPGWWTAFNASGNGEQKIRAIVDKYNIAGCIYNIQTY